MGTGLSRNRDAIDYSNCMIQLLPITLKPSLDGPSPIGHEAVRSLDELHVLGYEREEVVPPVVHDLAPSVRHVTMVALLGVVRRDLARVNRVFHERRTDENTRFPADVREGSRARPLDAGERTGHAHAQRDAIPRRRYLRHGQNCRHSRRRGRGRGRGRVTWGRLVPLVGLRTPGSAATATVDASLLGQL
jgi:hypothetical protein